MNSSLDIKNINERINKSRRYSAMPRGSVRVTHTKDPYLSEINSHRNSIPTARYSNASKKSIRSKCSNHLIVNDESVGVKGGKRRQSKRGISGKNKLIQDYQKSVRKSVRITSPKIELDLGIMQDRLSCYSIKSHKTKQNRCQMETEYIHEAVSVGDSEDKERLGNLENKVRHFAYKVLTDDEEKLKEYDDKIGLNNSAYMNLAKYLCKEPSFGFKTENTVYSTANDDNIEDRYKMKLMKTLTYASNITTNKTNTISTYNNDTPEIRMVFDDKKSNHDVHKSILTCEYTLDTKMNENTDCLDGDSDDLHEKNSMLKVPFVKSVKFIEDAKNGDFDDQGIERKSLPSQIFEENSQLESDFDESAATNRNRLFQKSNRKSSFS